MTTQIAQRCGVHPAMVTQRKKEVIENAGRLFTGKRGPKSVDVIGH